MCALAFDGGEPSLPSPIVILRTPAANTTLAARARALHECAEWLAAHPLCRCAAPQWPREQDTVSPDTEPWRIARRKMPRGERMPYWALFREDGMPCEISCRRGCAVVTVGARICARTRPTATRVTSAPGRGSPHCHICTRIRLPGSSSRELS
jgi:hypothetical protein